MLLCVTPSPAIDRTARVPRLAFDTILRPTAVAALPGGKGINCGRAALRLGALVCTTGLAGGHAGRWLVEGLEREGLSPRFVDVVPETRTTYVTVDERGRSVMVYEPAAALTPGDLDRLLLLLRDELLPGSRRVVLAGSLPPGVGEDGVGRLVAACREASVPVLVDTGGAALRAAVEARPDLVKVSLAEAVAAGFGGSGGAPGAAQALAAAGVGLAIVTDGPRGASAATTGSSWSVEVPRLVATNAVGSGDAFNAGLCVALDAGATVEEALAMGAAAGTANVEAMTAGMVDERRVNELLPRIVVRRMTSRQTRR